MRSSLLKLSSLLLVIACAAVQASELTLNHASDLQALGKAQQGDVIVLMVSQPACGYCVKVKEDYLEPLLKTADAPAVEVVSLGTAHSFVGFDGKQTTAEALTRQLNAHFTPTLLFVDSQGNTLHEPMVGLTTPEFYGYYLDEAIRTSREKLQ